MSVFGEFNRYIQMDDQFEIDIKFGLSMQCIWVMALAASYGVYYIVIGLYELLILMIFMFLCSLAMLAYSIRGGKHRSIIVCIGIGILSMLVHILVTYYVGNCGTVFFIVSSMLIPHLYPLLKLRGMIILDLMMVIVINFVFWISLNTTPMYADLVGNTYRFTLSNIGLAICLLELYVNIYSVRSLKTVRQRVVENASRDAYIDALTGLGNRRMLKRQQSSLEAEADTPLCVAMVDIDHFKIVNDTYGHAAGDRALVFLAETMRDSFRKSDLLIRWGGEEYLIVLRFTEAGHAEALMERFRKQIEGSAIAIDDGEIQITLTIGLAEHRFGTNLNDTITLADELLYQGKEAGRNRIVTKPL